MRSLIAAVFCCLVVCVSSARGDSWDAGAEYSIASNPAGVWAYGRRNVVEGTGFTAMTVRWGDSGWYSGNAGHGGPSIMGSPAMWAKDNSNGFPVVRWTAPAPGFFDLTGAFTGADSRGVNNFVYVVANGVMLFEETVSGNGTVRAFGLSEARVEAGQSIDFILRWNGVGNSEHGWTRVGAVISDSAWHPALIDRFRNQLFDISGDGSVNVGDIDYLIRTELNTQFGDANLDGRVSIGDLVIMGESFGGNGGWGDGDFSGDGRVSIGDLTIMAEHFGFNRNDVGVAIPEVSSVAALGLALAAGARRRRERRGKV